MSLSDNVEALVAAIHAAPAQFVLYCTGAGSEAVYWLQSASGSSKSLLEASVPYSRAALDEALDYRVLHRRVSKEVACRLAGRAFTRAVALYTAGHGPAPPNSPPPPVFGVACSAALVSGASAQSQSQPHRACVATWGYEGVRYWYLLMHPGQRGRKQEEDTVSRTILNAVATAKGVPDDLLVSIGVLSVQSGGGDLTEGCWRSSSLFAPAIERVTSQRIPYILIPPHGSICEEIPRAGDGLHYLYTGSFNPFHEGHRRLMQALERFKGKEPLIELSAINVDKPPLSADVALRRVAQFAGRWAVVVSSAPLFLDKARLFARCVFVVGFDTAIRVLQQQYYGDSEQNARAALAEIKARGCSFLVAGRVKGDTFCTFQAARSSLPLPEFHDMFEDIPENVFRFDISSTQLRQEGRGGTR